MTEKPEKTLPEFSAKSGKRASRTVPRLAYSPDEASRALGVSRDFFDEHIAPELRMVRMGRRRLVPVKELERFLERFAARAC